VRGGPHHLIVGEHASPIKGHVGADEELLLVAEKEGPAIARPFLFNVEVRGVDGGL
jgi:hypothetical protein